MEPPAFDDRVATFSVTFPNHALLDEATQSWLSELDVAGLSRAQLTALARARRGEILTNVGYRAATGVADSRAATAHLQELRRRGLLEQAGTRGQTTYRLGPAALRPTRGRGSDDDLVQIVLRSLSTVPVSRREIAAITNLADAQVIGALRRLRAMGEAELVGLPRSRNAKWRATR